jgi:hypothetical protein
MSNMQNIIIDEMNAEREMDKEDQKQSILEMLMEADEKIFNSIIK